MVNGLVKGEGFAVDASAMEATASRYRGKAPDELDWTNAQRQKRRWPSIWQHWRPKLDRKTTQNAATAQMADASVSRHQSLHLPGDPHALLTCGALTVVATMLGDAG